GLDLSIRRNGARIPKAIFAAKDHDGAAGFVEAEGARCIEWHPPKVAMLARSPSWAASCSIARIYKDPCHGVERVAHDSKLSTRAGHKLNEIKLRRPLCAPPLRLPLRFATVIPRIIHRPGHAPQMLGAGLVLDTVAVCENHRA